MFDLIIIGAGAAGLTAGIFAARRGLKTCIVSKDLGGQTASTAEIENYPGVGRIEGPELIGRFYQEAQTRGCEFLFEEMVLIRKEEDIFTVQTIKSILKAQIIILAFGKTPRDLGISDEKRWRGHGLEYCGVWDAERYRGKIVAVIGGGNSALDTVWRLRSVAERIYLIHRRGVLSGERVLLERIAHIAQLERIMNSTVHSLFGDKTLEGIIVEDNNTHISRNISIHAIFAAIGFEPRVESVRELVDIDESNQIMTDHAGATSCPGVFAAGDITHTPYKQISISAGEGARAALSAYAYFQKRAGKRPITVDWGVISQ